jgi:hypothetical protein
MKLLKDDDDDVIVVIFHKTRKLQWKVRLLILVMEMVVEIMFIMMTDNVVIAVKDVDKE